MKRFLTLATAAILIALPVQAQDVTDKIEQGTIGDGFVDGTADFFGNAFTFSDAPGTATAPINSAFFRWDVTVDGVSGQVDFLCTDAERFIQSGTVDVRFHRLSGPSIGATATSLGYDLGRLQRVGIAWEAITLLDGSDIGPSLGTYALDGSYAAQCVVWEIMGTTGSVFNNYCSQYAGGSASDQNSYDGLVGFLEGIGGFGSFGTPSSFAGTLASNPVSTVGFSEYYLMVHNRNDGSFGQPQFVKIDNTGGDIPVPTPGTAVLLASGLLGLGIASRRRRDSEA